MPKPHLPYPPRKSIVSQLLFFAAALAFGAAMFLFGRGETVDCYAQKLEDRKVFCSFNQNIQVWFDGSKLFSLPKGVGVSIDLPESLIKLERY
jgi:Domain of unknown function (DUF4406)